MSLQGHCNLLDEAVSTGSAVYGGDGSPRTCRSERLTTGVKLQRGMSHDSLSLKYKRMKCAVIVMATLMILASMLLVGVSLAMAEHIDELGKRFTLVTARTYQPFELCTRHAPSRLVGGCEIENIDCY